MIRLLLLALRARLADPRDCICSCDPAFYPDAVDIACPEHGLAYEVGAGELGRTAGADTPGETA